MALFKSGVSKDVGGGHFDTHKLSGDAVQERKGSLPPQARPSPEHHESQEAIVAAELQAMGFNCATARS